MLRGFGVGALGGLLAFIFARIMAEPVIQSYARAVRLLVGELLKVLPLPGGARLVREVGLPRLLHR